MKRLIAVSLLMLGLCTWLNASESEYMKAHHLMDEGDKLMKEKQSDKALPKYIDAKAQLVLAQAFGQFTGPDFIILTKIGNGYALTGNVVKATAYYYEAVGHLVRLSEIDGQIAAFVSEYKMPERTAESPPQYAGGGAAMLERMKNDVITSFGEAIKGCATCKYSMNHWEALADLYRVTGDLDKASRTEAELAIHREANDAYDKEEKKAGGLGFAGTLAAVATGVNAAETHTSPPPVVETPEQVDASIASATSKAWHAKMVVYQKHNRPEYVAQTVQEMRNSQ